VKCERYILSLYSFSCIDRELIRRSVFRDLSNNRSTAGICELILAKSGLCVTDIDFIIDYLCVFVTFVLLCVLMYDFHNK